MILLTKWMLLAVLMSVSALASDIASDEEEWSFWTAATPAFESATERTELPVDVTTILVAEPTETVMAMTELEMTTPAVTTKAAPVTKSRVKTSSEVTTLIPELLEEDEEEVLSTTDAPTTISTTTKRPRSKSSSSKSKTATTLTSTTTVTTTTESIPTAGGLSEFLKRRKIERIMATTEVDPFIAILATATPSTGDNVFVPTTESPHVSISTALNQRFATRRKFKTTPRPRQTTAAPVDRSTHRSATLDVPAIRPSGNRLGNLKSKSFGRGSSTITTPRSIAEDLRPSVSSSRPRFSPKRKSSFSRPVVNNGIGKKQTTSTAAPADDETATETSSRSTPRRGNFRVFKANRN